MKITNLQIPNLDKIDDPKTLAELYVAFSALAEYAEERRAWECMESKFDKSYSAHFDPFYEKLPEFVRWPQPNRYEGQAEQ